MRQFISNPSKKLSDEIRAQSGVKSKQLELAKKISTISRKTNINRENIDQVLQDLGLPKKQTPVKDKGKEKADQPVRRQKININRENIDQVLKDLEVPKKIMAESEIKPMDPQVKLAQAKKDLSLSQPEAFADAAEKAESLEIKDLLQGLSGTLNTYYTDIYDSTAEKNPADELAYKIKADAKNIIEKSELILNGDKIQENKALRSITKSLNSIQTIVSNYVAKNNADPEFKNKIDQLKTNFLKDLKKEVDARRDISVKQPFDGTPDIKIKNVINSIKESEDQFNETLNNLIQDLRGMKGRFGRNDKKYLKEAIDILENHRKISKSLLSNLEEIDNTTDINEKMTMFLSKINSKAINDFMDQQDNIMNWLESRYLPQEKRFSKLARNFAKKHPEKLDADDPLDSYADKLTEHLRSLPTQRRKYKLTLDEIEKYSETMSDEAKKQVAHLCTLIDLRNAQES